MIHPAAVVDPRAKVAADVEIGPYAVIGEHVEIGSGCRVGPHAVITGRTRIGRNNRIYQFVSLGEAPQDKKYGGQPTRLEIGDGNTIREFCTFNCGTAMGTIVLQDIPPYVMASGNFARPYGVNQEGLKRRGFDAATIGRIKRAYKTLYKSGLTLEQAKAELMKQVEECPAIQPLLEFVDRPGRGIIR